MTRPFASNMVPGDSNDDVDVFVWDRETKGISLVSVNSDGVQADHNGEATCTVSISANGRYVAFGSDATNLDLVIPDTNSTSDVYVRDLVAGTTVRVSLTSSGGQSDPPAGGDGAIWPDISADGRYVVFESNNDDLVPGDTNGRNGWDVFLRDTVSGTTTAMNVNVDGDWGNGRSEMPVISDDGRFVSFLAESTNLIPGQLGGYNQFVRDRTTGDLIQLPTSGGMDVIFGADGRYVGFASSVDDLVPGDTNGQLDAFDCAPLRAAGDAGPVGHHHSGRQSRG